MIKKQSIILAAVGVGLVAAFPARAQLTYNDNDLLLNFRNSSRDSGNDVEVDLGPVSAFLGAVASAGGTVVLDSGTGFNTSSYAPQFTADDLTGDVSSSGDATTIAFSAAAENLQAAGNAQYTLWLTRQITPSQETTGGAPSFQDSNNNQTQTADRIQSIGYEADATFGDGSASAFGSSLNGSVVPDSDAESYHSQARTTASPDVISYGGYVTGTGTSPLEATPSAGAVYQALWQVPASGAGSDVYEGFFTFLSDGELDFTLPTSAPPPATNRLTLTIVFSAPNSVQVLWPDTGTNTLQQNSDIAVSTGWQGTGFPINTSNGTNSITITPPTGNLFFRLTSSP